MGCYCHSKCYGILIGLSGMHMPSFSTWDGHLANLQRVIWWENGTKIKKNDSKKALTQWERVKMEECKKDQYEHLRQFETG